MKINNSILVAIGLSLLAYQDNICFAANIETCTFTAKLSTIRKDDNNLLKDQPVIQGYFRFNKAIEPWEIKSENSVENRKYRSFVDAHDSTQLNIHFGQNKDIRIDNKNLDNQIQGGKEPAAIRIEAMKGQLYQELIFSDGVIMGGNQEAGFLDKISLVSHIISRDLDDQKVQSFCHPKENEQRAHYVFGYGQDLEFEAEITELKPE